MDAQKIAEYIHGQWRTRRFVLCFIELGKAPAFVTNGG
jgi:hypothetical protein